MAEDLSLEEILKLAGKVHKWEVISINGERAEKYRGSSIEGSPDDYFEGVVNDLKIEVKKLSVWVDHLAKHRHFIEIQVFMAESKVVSRCIGYYREDINDHTHYHILPQCPQTSRIHNWGPIPYPPESISIQDFYLSLKEKFIRVREEISAKFEQEKKRNLEKAEIDRQREHDSVVKRARDLLK